MEDRTSRPAEAAGEPRVPALATRAHRLSLAVNAALAVLKLGAGFLFASPALVADGWHSAADTVSSVIAWLGQHLGAEPADEDHHYGHGNLEALAGLVIGLVLVVGGGLLVVESADAALGGAPDPDGAAAGGVALAMTAAGISILANLGLARVTSHAAERVGSLSLRALTRDNLGDALSSVIVVVAIGFRAAGVPELEHVVAGLIGILIAGMGLASVRSGFDVLMVRVTDPELRRDLAEAARAVPDVRGVQSVRLHPLGSDVRIDLEISVDGTLSVTEGHAIAHRVEEALRDAREVVREVHVHVNPCLPGDLAGSNLLSAPTPGSEAP